LGWKADLMTRAGRVVHVQFIRTAMLIYLVMATELPTYALKAIDKTRRGFLWRGCKKQKEGIALLLGQRFADFLSLVALESRT
jgi:hypothetical protein